MATTYHALQKQIDTLQAQAAKLKSEEVSGVVARIKEAISTYSLTSHDIFAGWTGAPNFKADKGAKAKPVKASVTAKYTDGKGGEWVGRGKRPRWLQEALAAGKKLEDFAISAFKSAVEAVSSTPATPVAPFADVAPKKRGPKGKVSAPGKKAKASKPAGKPGKPAVATAKFSDGAGNSWSGMGPRPGWFKAALAAGKTPEDLLTKG